MNLPARLGGTAVAVLAIAVCGCASSLEQPHTQEITVQTNPAGANCTLVLQGVIVARINPTPGKTTIKTARDDLTVICNKPGYKESSYLGHSREVGRPTGSGRFDITRIFHNGRQMTIEYEPTLSLKLTPLVPPSQKPQTEPVAPTNLTPGEGPA